MTEPVNLGLVGTGALGMRVLAHLTLPDIADAVVISHICDPAPGRAAAVASRFGLPRWSESVEELLEDSRVHAVSIASPIGLHYEHGLAALRAGKHVHFNKTMSVRSAQATELIAEAQARGLKIVASPGEVLRPHIQRIKELIGEGAIGRLCWAACGAAFWNYHVDEPERRQGGDISGIDPSWYFRSPGGGPLYDMTVYALHGLTTILGSARRVTAMSGIRVPERIVNGRAIVPDAHDNTAMLLDFGENLFAFVYGTAAGILSEGKTWDPDGRYYGTEGSITGLMLNGQPFDYPGRELISGAADGNQWLLPHVGPSHRELTEQHVFEDIMQLVESIRTDVPSVVSAEHARHVIEIIEAAYNAAATGITQDLHTTIEGTPPAETKS